MPQVANVCLPAPVGGGPTDVLRVNGVAGAATTMGRMLCVSEPLLEGTWTVTRSVAASA